MWVNSFRLADRVDVAKHIGAAAVISSDSAHFWRRRIAVSRVVRRQQDCAGVLFFLDALQLRREKFQLQVSHARPLFPKGLLTGNESGILKSIAKEPDDSDKRGIEAEI